MLDTQLREIIASHLCINTDDVDYVLANGGVDSLDEVDLRLMIEDRYDLELTNEDFAGSLTSLENLTAYVTSCLATKEKS